MIAGLIDNRNSTLLNELNKNYKIKVELVSDTEEYVCQSMNHRSTIYVPETKICADSFTHELLHIYLRSKGIFIGARLKRKLQSSKTLSLIYSEQLLEHIGNCLDHIKTLPIYLEMGYDKSKFIHDYEKNKFTTKEVQQIKDYWMQGQKYNAQVIEFYLEKYFAAKACPNNNFDYSYNLQELRHLDEQIFLINEKLIGRWAEMKIDHEGLFEEDYIIIAEDYIAEMEDWAKSRILIKNVIEQ